MPDLVVRYVKLVRCDPVPLLIAIVWVKGFVFGWLRRYTHTLPGELERARDLLDKFLVERTAARNARG